MCPTLCPPVFIYLLLIVVLGKQCQQNNFINDLSDISGPDVDDGISKESHRSPRDKKLSKVHHKHRKSKQAGKENGKTKDYKKSRHHHKKKSDVLSETSDESDDKYRNKRRKLANAVLLNKNKTDTSTLKDRLTKMLCIKNNDIPKAEPQKAETERRMSVEIVENIPVVLDVETKDKDLTPSSVYDLIDLCSNEETVIVSSVSENQVNGNVVENHIENSGKSSDEDIELLRQNALQTKSSKKTTEKKKSLFTKSKTAASSEDDDSDTTELRMICLKSALLKKAFEMKQKQKLQKRLSQSNIQDDFDIESNKTINDSNNFENSTDIESVDMDIGSDGEEKEKDLNIDINKSSSHNKNENINCFSANKLNKEDELEEDEDLLRARLLTSLSKNLPNLVEFNIINTVLNESDKSSSKKDFAKQSEHIKEKKFIIHLGESDSEGENEATNNLKKMHSKLSEQEDFQKKLDLFLKASRMQVEKKILPDVVQPPSQKDSPKFVPKAMNHLPKSEQIEYKNLVKRMAELEKIKQARQASLNSKNKLETPTETLKPHNVTLIINSGNKIDEKIALSRKNIAEESIKMLQLKEEAKKLSQRYKMAITELRNINTAITINKKQQRAIQSDLYKVRLQHQMLLKSANCKHTPSLTQPICKSSVTLQKENNPSKNENESHSIVKTVKINLVNDLNKNTAIISPTFSVEVDIIKNKKVIEIPKNDKEEKIVQCDKIADNNCDNKINENIAEINKHSSDMIINKNIEDDTEITDRLTKKDTREDIAKSINNDLADYRSPLEALSSKNWEEDPNTFLCPYDINGSCRDPECKYLHPKIPSQQ